MNLKNFQFDEYTSDVPDSEVLEESWRFLFEWSQQVTPLLLDICNNEFFFQLVNKFIKKYLTQIAITIFDQMMILKCRILTVKFD